MAHQDETDRYAANRLDRLQAMTAALTSARSAEDVAAAVLQHGLANPGASAGAFWVPTDDGTALRLVHGVGLADGMAARFARMPLDSGLPAVQVFRTGRPVYVGSLAERNERWPELVDAPTFAEAFAVVPLAVEGRTVGCLAMGFPEVREFDEQKRRFLAAIGDQSAQALERARLYEAERRSAERLSFLAEASKVLASTLDYGRTLTQVAELSERMFGGCCALDLADSPVTATVLRSTELIVPLVVGGAAIGMLTISAEPGSRPYAAEDVALAEELAGRAAVAIANARLFQERSEIAHTLQRRLLPPRLPDIEGVDLAARFRAAYEGLEIGGDFYDVFPVHDRWALVIGDVVGNGAHAAATTALVRHTARAVAPYLPDPRDVLSALNDAIAATGEDTFCTLLFGLLLHDGAGLRITLVSAGHPAPFVVRRSGVEPVAVQGTLLGPFDAVEAEPVDVLLREGDALVCFTDGVLEARAAGAGRGAPPEAFFGEDRLRAALAGGGTADELAARVEAAAFDFAGGEVGDDVAILVVAARA